VARGSRGSPLVRIRREVLEVYRDTARKYSISLSSLISAVLLLAPCVNSREELEVGVAAFVGRVSGVGYYIISELREGLRQTCNNDLKEVEQKVKEYNFLYKSVNNSVDESKNSFSKGDEYE